MGSNAAGESASREATGPRHHSNSDAAGSHGSGSNETGEGAGGQASGAHHHSNSEARSARAEALIFAREFERGEHFIIGNDTYKHTPKRNGILPVFELCNRLINSASPDARYAGWVAFTLVPQWIGWRVPKGRHKHKANARRIINRRIRRFLAWDWRALHAEAVEGKQAQQEASRTQACRKTTNPVKELKRLITKVRCHAEAGQWAKALQILESLGTAPRTIQQLQKFQDKFPQVTPLDPVGVEATAAGQHPDVPDRLTISLTPKDFRNYIRGLQKHKAQDALGWRVEGVKPLAYDTPHNVSTDSLRILRSICNGLARGAPPRCVREALYMSTGCALKKKDHDGIVRDAIRPVCVTGLFRKIVTGTLLRAHIASITHELEEIQQFGTSADGNSRVIHRITALLQANPEFVVVKMDIENAFNSITREAILHGLQQLCPMLIPTFWTFMRGTTRSYFRETISSTTHGSPWCIILMEYNKGAP